MGLRTLVAAVALAAATPAAAQMFVRDIAALGMGKAEWALMRAAAESLLATDLPPAEGAEARWTAPSGVHGVVVAENAKPHASGAHCAVLRHDVTFPRRETTETARERRCYLSGAWLISAE
jgi:hypothetical protein